MNHQLADQLITKYLDNTAPNPFPVRLQDSAEVIMFVTTKRDNRNAEYKGLPPEDNFGGIISRNPNVPENLNILQLTRAQSSVIEGERIDLSR